MRHIYKYIGLLVWLFLSITGYTQNQLSDGGFESGCVTSGWSSDMFQNCTDYTDWGTDIETHSQGEYTVATSGSSVQSPWTGTPHSGDYYFVGDGIWSSNCPTLHNRGWYANANVYQGNSYIFSSWYRYEDTPTGTIYIGFNPTSSYTSSIGNPSDLSSIGSWNQQSSTYYIPSSSTNPTSVELDILIFTNGFACENDELDWTGNDFGLDDVFFGTICDGDGNPPPFYYQNTENLPSLTQATIIEAGSNILGGTATLGNVEVESTQNVTFTAGDYVDLEPGFIADNGSVFLAQIGSVAGACLTSLPCSTCRQGDPTIPANNLTANPQFKIYPNPTSGQVNIDFNYTKSQTVAIEVLDIVGKQVYSENLGQIQTGHIEANLSNEPAGMYIVKITANNTATTQKIVLAK